MSRQVDIKAIVSHIVRGDGADKCRICMGDTSDGQVYLGDTVMMDGERPVTLSELLETVAGVEVPVEPAMPAGVCWACCRSAMNAARFRKQCQEAVQQWNCTVHLLDQITHLKKHTAHKKAILSILEKGNITLIDDFTDDKKEFPSKTSKNIQKKKVKVASELPQTFSCPDCGKMFVSHYFLYIHLREASHRNRACYLCGQIMCEDELISHIQHKHGQTPHRCKICHFVFRSQSMYQKHIKVAHKTGKYTCAECGRSFLSSQAYSAHKAVHDQQVCPGCSKIFRNRRCYVYHVQKCCDLRKDNINIHRTKHKMQVEIKSGNNRRVKVGLRGSSDKECICDYCGKKYAGKRFVSAHIQIVHLKNTHRPCAYCGKYLASAHMGEHVKRHESKLSFTCQYCDLELNTKLGYTQHLRLHTGEKPYPCQFCSETFYASSKRSLHTQKVHKNKEVVLKYKCDICPAKFKLPYLLKRHLSSVHEIDDHIEFECGRCYEKFSSESGLKHHSRKHQQVFLKKNTKMPA